MSLLCDCLPMSFALILSLSIVSIYLFCWVYLLLTLSLTFSDSIYVSSSLFLYDCLTILLSLYIVLFIVSTCCTLSLSLLSLFISFSLHLSVSFFLCLSFLYKIVYSSFSLSLSPLKSLWQVPVSFFCLHLTLSSYLSTSFSFFPNQNFLCLYLHIFTLSCSSPSFPAHVSLDCDHFTVEQQPQTIFKLTSAAPEEVYLYGRHTYVCVCTIKRTHCAARMLSRISFSRIFSSPFAPTWYAPKNMLYKLFKLFTQVHNKEQRRERGRERERASRLAAILVFLPLSPICFSLHNLWRLIMFRQNDKRDTQTCGLAMISAAGSPSLARTLLPPHPPHPSPSLCFPPCTL